MVEPLPRPVPPARGQRDPDEQVQAIVRLIFRKFEELGTLNGVLQDLVRHDLQVGIRVPGGPDKGELVWRRPNRLTLQNLLKNPIYAGAYAYGRRSVEPRRKQPGRPYTGRVVRSLAEWQVFLPNRVPAYITWDQYEHNQARPRANQARVDTVGAARAGSALLAGLLVCGRCGARLIVRYDGRGPRATYACWRRLTDYGGERCQSLAGPPLDRDVTEQVLAALEPAALELAVAAAQNLERARAELTQLWQQRRERAAYEAERAARQYRLVEPENRLVARQLERDWEEKLTVQQHLEEDFRRFEREQPRPLTPAEVAAIRQLAAAIPALWDAPTTTPADRQEILRQVIERVIVTAVGATEQVAVTIEWVGGLRTEGHLTRPVARLEQLSYYPQLCQRLATLAAAGLPARAIAERLNAEGYRPPKRRERFGPRGVQDLLRRLDLVPPHPRAAAEPDLGEHEWWRPDLARQLGMPEITLYTWIRRGWVTARRQEQPPHRWILRADPAEVARLRELRRRPPGADARQRWLAAHPLLPPEPPAAAP